MTQCTISTERCGGLCTGYDGSKIWDERKKINSNIDCETCRDKADHLETFSHDVVNATLGKKIFDKTNWDNYVKIVKCANDSCKKEGRC